MEIIENKPALTVKELIDMLNNLPQDAKVYTEEYRGWQCNLVKVVEVLHLKKGLISSKPMVLLRTE